MRNLSELKEELLQDSNVRKEYDLLGPEYQVKKAIIEARKSLNITQLELAKRTGIDRADISKLENGNANPSLKTLQRLANGLGISFQINFTPQNK